MAELAKAYVQIIPTAKGIKSNLSRELDGGMQAAGEEAGGTLGNSLVEKMKTVVKAGAVAIGALIGGSLMEGAKLEQSIGGIETMFKDSYSKVEKYANEAYKTAGVSANSYMEQVTSFSAALLQSLGGDTNKAAESANQALQDMSDNANKFGTDMESIQWAYQGFAKQNYTMLDNLKLGYGGTKAEMERLLADAQALTGVKYDINNLSDVYEAIHVIQENLGITGTTAQEAATTFSGSFNTMKSAAQNFLATLALGDKGTMDIQTAMTNLIQSTITFLVGNAIPMIVNVFSQLPSAIFAALSIYTPEQISTFFTNVMTWIQTFLTQTLPQFVIMGLNMLQSLLSGFMSDEGGLTLSAVLQFVTNIVTGIATQLPQILEAGRRVVVTLVDGLMNNLPQILNSAVEIIGSLFYGLISSLDQIIAAAVQIVGSLVTGLISNLPQIIAAGVQLIFKLVGALVDRLPQFLETGIEVILYLAKGLVQAIPSLLSKIPGMVSQIISGFGKLLGKIFDVGSDLVKGLWNGILSVKDWILGKISGFVDNILGGIKSFFGINSPSKLMRDEVGKFVAQGVGVGFEKEMTSVKKDMVNALPTGFDVTPTLSYNYNIGGIGRTGVNLWDNTNSRTEDNPSGATKYVIEIPVNLDGKTLVRETISYTDEELAKRERLISRGVIA